MLKKMLKNIFVVVSIMGVLFLSCIDMAFSQTKKTTKTSAKRASSTKAPAKKRAGTSNSSSRPSKKRSNTTTTSKKLNLSESATAFKADEDACRDAYVYCMDAQIKDIIDKYTYLYDDDAVQAYLETSEPFRCLYYDKKTSVLPQNMQIVSSCQEILNTATVSSFNASQIDMNNVVVQYSDYLKEATCSTTGEAKLEINSTPKTGICSSCTYKNLNSFLTSNNFVNTTWKNYQALCKEKYLVEKHKNETDLAKADEEYRNFVYENCTSREVNDLYFSYNYYCDLRTSTLKNAVGVKTSYCKLSSEDTDNKGLTGDALVRAEMANVFGTASSAEYYKEALKRLESGELKMVNFTNSNLYKQKIEGLGLETLKAYDISSLLNTVTKCDDGYRYNASVGACQLYNTDEGQYEDAGLAIAEYISPTKPSTCESGDTYDDMSKKCIRCQTNYKWNTIVRRCQNTDAKYQDIIRAASEEDIKDARSIYTDLGIERDNSLFSINVVPPLGSGLVFPSALFNKASEYCFDGKEKTLTGLSSSVRQTYVSFNKRKALLKQCSEEYKDDLERYYLSGYWPKEDVEPDSNNKYDLDTDYSETDFMSAKKSCDVYEQNLISVRNNNYAKFDTQIKNYLEDALALIIKNEMKDIQTIASVASTLQKNDSDLTLSNIKAKTERELARMDAEVEALNLEQERLAQQKEQDKQYIEEQKKLKDLIMEGSASAIINSCGTLGKNIVSEWSKGSDKSASGLLLKLSDLRVKVTSEGAITPYPVGGDVAAYDALDPLVYSEISCLDVGGFYSSSEYASIGSTIQNTLGGSMEESSLSGSGSGTLSPGIYYIEVAGGGGGSGGTYGGYDGKCHWHGSGNAGNGEMFSKIIFVMDDGFSYTYSVGAGGSGGDDRSRGNDGEPSTFSSSDLGISITARGGIASEGATRDDPSPDVANTGNGLGGEGGPGEPGRNDGCKSYGGNSGGTGWVKIYRYK